MKKQVNNRILYIGIAVFTAMLAFSCGNSNRQSDAFGNFESDEIIVSAQSQGILIHLNLNEGDMLRKDQLAGTIDTSSVILKKNQLAAQQRVIQARLKNLDAQLAVQDEQRNNLVREVARIEKLLSDKAATQQQYDDIQGKLNVLDSQTEAIRSQKSIILGEHSVLIAQQAEVDNMLEKCKIINPVNGTVLEKYVDAGELVIPGKAIYKIADISEMELKVYVSGSQLPAIAIGDTATVLIDSITGSMQRLTGTVTWISSEVEFTPKIIQTREERVNMVYAVKLRVRNDGRLKIGMPGEVVFGKR
ncbi:MAG TPA: efflux RND transporter periplasmic adaptor subunit [Bacteroidales bacterium]|nr:efflux RND transporter periplasmic adaptor subunit [Bacteroidales bacterium]